MNELRAHTAYLTELIAVEQFWVLGLHHLHERGEPVGFLRLETLRLLQLACRGLALVLHSARHVFPEAPRKLHGNYNKSDVGFRVTSFTVFCGILRTLLKAIAELVLHKKACDGTGHHPVVELLDDPVDEGGLGLKLMTLGKPEWAHSPQGMLSSARNEWPTGCLAPAAVLPTEVHA